MLHAGPAVIPGHIWYTLIMIFTFGIISATVHAAPDARVFLWSVGSKKNTVYLLGTVHVVKPDMYPLDKRIEKAYKNSGCIVFEADMREAALPATMKKMIVEGTYHDGTTLKQHISGQTYEIVREKVVSAGLGMDRFDPLKPWLCAVTLSSMELKKMGFDPALSMDARFFTRALEDKKELMFLESSGHQIDLISGALEDSPDDLLRQTIAELGVIGKMSEDIAGAWRDGDAAGMESIVGISLKDYPRIRNILFVQRNTKWTAKIEKLIGRDKDVLVIMGAGHLVGDRGVLAQLRDRGYPVVQQ